MSLILGIDLGTTNSCIAVAELSGARVLGNRDGSRTTPSIVAYLEGGDRLVGQVARRQAITNPRNTIFAVKRLIGRKADQPQVQRAKEILPYQVVAAPSGDAHVQLGEHLLSPQEISAAILMELKACAEDAVGEEISEAIITVPAYFDDAQRQATRDAGEIAGLEVLRIINEPTAAALGFGFDREADGQRIAVYDLGGGTFDISILQIQEGVLEVLATAGDTFLGGEDLDSRIMDWLIEDFREETEIDLRSDRLALQRLKEAAERAKCELSVAETASISLPFIATDEEGPRHLNRELPRETFENLVEDLVKRTVGPCEDALRSAELAPSKIDDVLLVGGQTRTPLVRRQVEEIFGRAPNREIHPEEVIAIGAALQGGIMAGEIKDIVLLDVTPLTLSVETRGGLVAPLIERNSTIPTKNTQIFTTVEDNQEVVSVHVLQGEREIASENRSLGRFELVGIPPSPRGVPQIEVTFAIDSNGIVNVSAHDVASDRSQGMEINPAGGLTRDEVNRLMGEAEKFAESDRQRRGLLRLKQRLEGVLHTQTKAFERLRSTMEEDEAQRISGLLREARYALSGEEREAIQGALLDLSELSERLTEGLMLEGLVEEAEEPEEAEEAEEIEGLPG